MTKLPSEHSPLGGSGATRWMACPGSARLSYGVADEEDEYNQLGTAAHTLAEACLRGPEWSDAWQSIGCAAPNGVRVDKEMADAVQVYLDAVRRLHPDYRLRLPGLLSGQEFNAWLEFAFHCPSIHEYFWGKLDFGYLETFGSRHLRKLHVWDYKHGVGVDVEVVRNPQEMYYACGVLESLSLWGTVHTVVLHIAQPRGFRSDGPLREWSITTKDLRRWMHEVLVPAMDRALTSRETASGEQCRFCPARARACPQVAGDFNELERMMRELSKKESARTLTSAQVGRFLDLLDVAKIVGKAVAATAFTRLESGHQVPGRKLVKVSKNRVWKDGAAEVLKIEYGSEALTSRELKSPAVVEKMSGGKRLTAEYAYKPDGGMTLARDDDTRPAAVEDMRSLLAAQAKKEEKK